MRNCPNCGQDVQEEELFCEHCGEKLEGAESVSGEAATTAEATGTVEELQTTERGNAVAEPEQNYSYAKTLQESDNGSGKKGMKLLIPVLAVILLLCAGFFAFGKKLFSGGVALSTEQKFLHYQQKYLKDKMDALVSLGFINEDLKQSSDFTFTGEIEGNEEMNKFLKDSQIQLKYDMDAEKNSFIMNLNARIMGTDILDGFADYRDGKIGFAIPLADPHYYRGDLKSVMKNLADEDVEAPDFKRSIENQKRLEKISEKYGDLLVGALNKDNLTVEKKEFTLNNLDKKYNGEVYLFKPTEKDLTALFEKVADTLEKDGDLEELLKDANATGSLNEALGTEDLSAPKDQLAELAKEIRENAASAAKDMVDNEFQWQIAVADGELRQILISAKESHMSLEIVKDGKDVTEQFNYADSTTDEFFLKNSYKQQDKNLVGSISGGQGMINITGVEYNIDTTKHSALMPYGTYTVKDPMGRGAEITLTVKEGEKGSSDHELVAKNLDAYYVPFSGAKLNLNTTKTGTAELSKEEEVDISNYSEEDFQELGQKLQEGLVGVFMTLQGELAG